VRAAGESSKDQLSSLGCVRSQRSISRVDRRRIHGYAPNRYALGLFRAVSVVGMRWPCDAVRLHSTVVLQRGGRRQSSNQGCREVLSAAGRMGQ